MFWVLVFSGIRGSGKVGFLRKSQSAARLDSSVSASIENERFIIPPASLLLATTLNPGFISAGGLYYDQ